MPRLDKSALAHQMHAVIRDRTSQVRRTKIEVYLLLARFKRARLYRHLSVPICSRHVGRICAERRFSTWEDYLASLVSYNRLFAERLPRPLSDGAFAPGGGNYGC